MVLGSRSTSATSRIFLRSRTAAFPVGASNTNFSFAFPIPGENGGANLGLPDLLFFALFLAASARWKLRPRLTWLLLTLSFGATLALAVWRDLGGLPALPLLALGFLLANADLLWSRVRTELREARSDRTETRSSGRSEP